MIDFPKLWDFLTTRFALTDSIHGPEHWRRVEATGLELAAKTGADTTVVRLFACLHDAERQNDQLDIEHGNRAAMLINEICGKLFKVTSMQRMQLSYACMFHCFPGTSDNPTIGTCWDADRLDLVERGLPLTLKDFSTTAAKQQLGFRHDTRNLLWHYTTGFYWKQINDCGYLEPYPERGDDAGMLPKLIWLTRNSLWESAAAAFPHSYEALGKDMEGVYRIGVKPEIIPYQRKDYPAMFSKEMPLFIADLCKTLNMLTDKICSKHYMTDQRIYRCDWQAVEKWNGRLWEPVQVAGQTEIALNSGDLLAKK